MIRVYEDYWNFVVDLVDMTMDLWDTPDRGTWKMRCEPRHFTYSKAMCRAAFDRGIRLARDLSREAPISKWEKMRDEIGDKIEKEGHEAKRGSLFRPSGDLKWTLPRCCCLSSDSWTLQTNG